MPWRPLPGHEPERFTRVGVHLDRLLRQLGAPGPGALTRLFEDWPRMVGERVGSHTEPVGLDRGRLVVRVDDPAWASELRWMEADLLTQLRSHLGADAPEGLEIRVGRAGAPFARPRRSRPRRT